MDRREWLRTGVVATGVSLALSVGLGQEYNNHDSSNESGRPKQIAEDPNFRYLVRELLPALIIASYEKDIHRSKENESLYIEHEHPFLMSKNHAVLDERYKHLLDKLSKVESKTGIFLSDADNAAKALRKRGYAYRCEHSVLDDKINTFTFGNITADKAIVNQDWGKNEKRNVVYFRDIVPIFEKYVNFRNSGGMRDTEDNLLYINQTALEEYAARIFNSDLKEARKNPAEFANHMLLREFEGDSIEQIFGKIQESVTHHEMNHGGEVEAQLSELEYGTTFLSLGTLYKSLNNNNSDQIKHEAAKIIFGRFKQKGYNPEDLLSMSREKIKRIVLAIHDSAN